MAKIDVIMGVYNCGDYLADSIESLLMQSFKDWRLIMCDDCSQDNTYAIAEKYAKKYPNKIVLLRNNKNMGLNYTLNKCLRKTTAKYIARHDGDDLSCPKRFEEEIYYLETHDDISFVSSNILLFDDNGTWGSVEYTEEPTKKDFLKIVPFCHAAVMIKRDAFIEVGGYEEGRQFIRVEDYNLWFKLYSKGYKGYNLQKKLYMYRDDRTASKRRTWRNRINEYLVRKNGYKMINVPWYLRYYKYRPILLGLLPRKISEMLHRQRLKPKRST